MSDILHTLRSEIIDATTVDELEELEVEICDRLQLARGVYATGLHALLASARRRMDAMEVALR